MVKYLHSMIRVADPDLTVPADPAERIRYEAEFARFAAVFPDAFYISERARVYADPAKIHPVHHRGPFYSMDGYHLSEPSRQRTPVLFQAGTSGRGQLFAARHAECVFISAPDPAAGMAAISRAVKTCAVSRSRSSNTTWACCSTNAAASAAPMPPAAPVTTHTADSRPSH